MQKQVNFFEQNVQWFALGLGGLFLVWMVFSYVLSQPVKVDVGGRTLGPGEVDPVTLSGPVEQLKRDIDKREIPEIRQRDYVQSFIAAIQGTSEPLALLGSTQINYVPPEGIDSDGVVPSTEVAELPVKELPKLPAARPVTFSSGRSTVTYPEPGWEPDPRRPQIQQPMVEADRDWVSLSFSINAEQLAKAFKAAFDEKKLDAALVPDPLAFMQTAIVDVELVRQQILPGGKLGKEEVVKPLLNSIRPPFPGKNAGEFEIFNYLNYISTNPNDVMYPVFYEVLSGDPWTEPTEDNERFAAQDRAARLAQRKLQQDQQRAAAQQRRQMQQQQRFRGGPGMMPGEFDEGMEYEGEAGEFGFMPPPPGGRFGGVIPQRPVRPGQRQPGATLQAGRFDVEVIDDLAVIAHDDTLEAGKTYRYKMRYRLLNPVYKGVRIAPAELTKEFAITSPYSGWSKPVTMRQKVEFFLARMNIAGEPKADFDVFEWKEGRMTKTTVSAYPGDAIGKTGWSMVDVRGSGRRAYGLLVDETGIMHRREPEDPNNPSDRYLYLQDEWELANPQVGMNR